MSIDETSAAACPHCGRSYRPSAWGRDYGCPTCGRPLAPRPRTARKPVSLRPLIYAGVALLAIGGGARLAADRLFRPQARGVTLGASAPTRLPPGFRESLLERLRYVEGDLRDHPRVIVLLRRAADTTLSLALLERDGNPAAAERWVRRARDYARRIRTEASALGDSGLEERVRSLERLEWGPPASIGRLTPRAAQPGVMSATSGRSLIARPAPLYVPSNLRIPGGDFGVGLPGSNPGPSYSRSPASTAGGAQSPLPRGAPMGLAPPEFAVPNRPDPAGGPSPLPTGSAQGSPTWEESVREARKEVRQHPDDDRRLWDLAYLLEQRVRVPTRRRPASIEELRNNPLAQEVIALHLKAARLTKLSVHRGTYYHDAARMYGRLRDDQRQYHYVRLALKETPYVHAYWSDLRDSCLRLGKIDESRRAAANARKWLLPSAQLPGPEAVPAPPSRF